MKTSNQLGWRPGAALCGVLAVALASGLPAAAIIRTVDIVADENDGLGCVPLDCSLREALAVAVDLDTIVIDLEAPNTTITLTLGQLVVDDDVTIEVVGPATIAGTPSSRLFSVVTGATVSMSGLTLRTGRAQPASPDGGCILVAGDLTLEDVLFEQCDAADAGLGENVEGGDGGAIFVALGGNLTATGVSFVQNTAGNGGGAPSGLRGGHGGAVAVEGSAEFDFVRFDSNRAGNGGAGGPNGPGGEGGAIAVVGAVATLAVNHAVLLNNRSGDGALFMSGPGRDGHGGAVFCGGDCGLSNATLSGNTIGSTTTGAAAQGGALYVSAGTTRLRNVTIVANTANGSGGGLSRAGGTVLTRNSLFANNNGAGTADDCFTNATAGLVSEGFNLLRIADGCSASLVGSDLSGTTGAPLDPQIGVLAANGSALETHELLAGSPAIDAGDAGGCVAWNGVADVALNDDQRLEPRPNDGDGDTVAVCDIGAFEAAAVAPVFHDLEVTVSGGLGGGTVQSAPAGINCPGDCAESFVFTAEVTLTPNAAVGFAFSGWSGDCSGSGSCEVAMMQDRVVTAEFVATFYLDVTLAGPGSGTVESSPAGVSCPGTCSAAFIEGEMVSLAATPAVDSLFLGWGGDCSGSAACSVTLDADRDVTATFLPLLIFADGFEVGDVCSWSAVVGGSACGP